MHIVNYFIIAVTLLLVFVIVYPVAEWNIACPSAYTNPDGNDNCFMIKDVLWQTVFHLSLFHGDGMSLTESVDEQEGKSIIPLVIALALMIAYRLRSHKK